MHCGRIRPNAPFRPIPSYSPPRRPKNPARRQKPPPKRRRSIRKRRPQPKTGRPLRNKRQNTPKTKNPGRAKPSPALRRRLLPKKAFRRTRPPCRSLPTSPPNAATARRKCNPPFRSPRHPIPKESSGKSGDPHRYGAGSPIETARRLSEPPSLPDPAKAP